jgi:hypothetical protein
MDFYSLLFSISVSSMIKNCGNLRLDPRSDLHRVHLHLLGGDPAQEAQVLQELQRDQRSHSQQVSGHQPPDIRPSVRTRSG